jgi:hypothetical protein
MVLLPPDAAAPASASAPPPPLLMIDPQQQQQQFAVEADLAIDGTTLYGYAHPPAKKYIEPPRLTATQRTVRVFRQKSTLEECR